MSDVARASKDWPQLNFVIHHGGYRCAGGGRAEDAWAQFERTGRIDWVTDLAEIPEELRARYGLEPLGAADGPVKRAILGENNARLSLPVRGRGPAARRAPRPGAARTLARTRPISRAGAAATARGARPRAASPRCGRRRRAAPSPGGRW